jgi:hypothetical protein
MASSTDDPDPDPGQAVTVRVFVTPAAKGCKIDYSLVGTDGYLQADTPITDIQGAASFTVPGGAEGVVDEIEFKTENGFALTETYTLLTPYILPLADWLTTKKLSSFWSGN